jgi:hypothetical protein
MVFWLPASSKVEVQKRKKYQEQKKICSCFLQRLLLDLVKCTFGQMAFGQTVFGQMVFKSNGLSVKNFR